MSQSTIRHVNAIKEVLPTVNVKLTDGTKTTGKVLGRLNDFATVTVDTKLGEMSREVAWETLSEIYFNNGHVNFL